MPIHISVKPSLRMFSLWLGESIQASNISFDVTLDTPLHINMFSPNALKLIPSSVTAVEQLAPFGPGVIEKGYDLTGANIRGFLQFARVFKRVQPRLLPVLVDKLKYARVVVVIRRC